MIGQVWRQPIFRGLSDMERQVTLYLLVGPQPNACGLMYLNQTGMVDDLGRGDVVPVMKAFESVLALWKWQYDFQARVLFVPQWFGWFPPANEREFRASLRGIGELPETALKATFLAYRRHVPQSYWPVLDQIGQGVPASKRVATVDLTEEAEASLFGSAPRLVVNNEIPEAVVKIWNETVTDPLPKCQRVTPALRKKIQARWKEEASLEKFRAVFAAVNAEAYCRGESDNEEFKGWLADIRHPLKSADKFQWFLERSGRVVKARVAVGQSRVPNCRHTPACGSMTACTSKRLQEMG